MELENPKMDPTLDGHDENDCGFSLRDERGNRHTIVIDWDGNVLHHGNDEYPKEPAERTDEEARIMCQVEARAKYAAQREFPAAEILPPNWDPVELARGLEAIEMYSVSAFSDEFHKYYRMVTDPTAFVDVPLEDIGLIWQLFFVDDDNRISHVPQPIMQYTDDGETALYNFDPAVDDHPDTKMVASLPAMEFEADAYEFPEGFQVFLIEHIAAQIHDAFVHMGEEPPAPYDQFDVIGLPATCADAPLFEDERPDSPV